MSEEKVFTKIQKGASIPLQGKQLIASFFQKQGNMFKSKRWFVMYSNAIFYFNEQNDPQPKGFTLIDFDLRFEVIREKVENTDNSQTNNSNNSNNQQNQLGKPKGIRFDRENSNCELFSNNEQEIIKWRDILRGRINQRGFHELFRAQKKMNKGSFASVYLAERLEDKNLFAVKAFSKEAAFGQENGKEAIINEIQLMRELDNQYIMKLHEVFETDNSLYFILDLLAGGQLYDKIKAKYKFSQEESKKIMIGLTEGLHHMHSNDIMHRDLKPENILFRKQNQCDTVVIADLGLGTKVHLKEYLFVRCGTPGFVAPEVVNIKDLKTTYDSVCDMFSLGLIFHILLIGRSPFNGQTYNEVLAQNRNGSVKLDGPEFLRVSSDAYDLLKKLLEKDPTKRITSSQAIKHNYFLQKEQKKIQQECNQDQKKQLNQDESKENSQQQQQQQGITTNGEWDSVEDEVIQDDEDKNANNIDKNMQNMKNEIDIKKIKNNQSPQQWMNSPQLIPRQLQNQILEQDSCVQFKMNKSPILFGKNEGLQEEHKGGNIIETPSLNKRYLQSPNQMLNNKSKLSTHGLNALKEISEKDEYINNQQQQQPQKSLQQDQGKKNNNKVLNNLKGFEK